MSLWLNGQSTVWALLTSWVITEAEMRFTFGFTQLAYGDIVIPFTELLHIDTFDPSVAVWY